MIGSALRSEIDTFCLHAFGRVLDEEHLARCASSLQRLTRGLHAGAGAEGTPSMRALASLVERTIAGDPPTQLAYGAFAEQLAVTLRLPTADRQRVEDALDAIDDVVHDPRRLPALRQALRVLMEQFDRACEEVPRAPRRHADIGISAP